MFAFVCFKEAEHAKAAFEELPKLDPFEKGTYLYCNWAMKKRDRADHLQKQFKNHVNETNLYTKNIRPDVTLELLKAAYADFGEIRSAVIKQPANPAIFTRYGFIDFANKLEAQKALIGGPVAPQVKQLYEQERVYINIFMPRHIFDAYRKNRAHQMTAYHVSQKAPSPEQQQINMF